MDSNYNRKNVSFSILFSYFYEFTNQLQVVNISFRAHDASASHAYAKKYKKKAQHVLYRSKLISVKTGLNVPEMHFPAI